MAQFGAKIDSVTVNRRRKGFEFRVGSEVLFYAFSQADPPPSAQDPVQWVKVYDVLGGQVQYMLASGRVGIVDFEDVLYHNRDPDHHRRVLLNQLTMEARNCVWSCPRSKKEIMGRLGTSASQLSRLRDPRNERKTLDRMVTLLYVLGYELDVTVRPRDD